MPLMPVVCHATLVQANDFTTRLTAFCTVQLKAEAAIRSTITHQILLTGEKFVTFETGKVSHVPATTFRFSTFVRKNYLKHKQIQYTDKIYKVLVLLFKTCVQQKTFDCVQIYGLQTISEPLRLQAFCAISNFVTVIRNLYSSNTRNQWTSLDGVKYFKKRTFISWQTAQTTRIVLSCRFTHMPS